MNLAQLRAHLATSPARAGERARKSATAAQFRDSFIRGALQADILLAVEELDHLIEDSPCTDCGHMQRMHSERGDCALCFCTERSRYEKRREARP